MESAERPSHITRIRNWYRKFERPISSISLIGGFVFDAITLTRIDRFWDNLWVAGHLVIVGACIILVNAKDGDVANGDDPEKIEFWLVNIMQFFFGGLFSTYLVFYFRSGTISDSWPFLVILLAAFIANESLKKHYTRLIFQISLFFLCVYSFAIFIVPVIVHHIGTWVFLLSGGVSLVIIALFLLVIKYSARERYRRSQWPLRIGVIIIFVGINVLYFYNLIPPIPLSLKDAGIYNSLTVNAPGQYTVTYENQGWLSFFNTSQNVQLVSGDPLYAYTAIFSPTSLNTQIIHEWQYYDTKTNSWSTKSRVSLSVIGGRDGGYRTFSMIDAPAAGRWRVDVETTQGGVIGILQFNVIPTSTEPAFVTKNID